MRMRLIVGLGNPGAQYENTRHNVGFMVVDKLAGEFGISVTKNKFEVRYGSGTIGDQAVMLAKPMAFMNRSGWPVQKLAAYFKINSKDVIVIHDDIDLAFGRFKIKEKGGHGGHKGLKSIIQAVGQDAFVRLRIGVGRSETGNSVSDHVLGPFDNKESKLLDAIINRARDAVVTILTEGTKVGMNQYNTKDLLLEVKH
ncbi:MAG: aminoacyl-tRNA hydrolase [Desulfobacterales bacterium]|jgi:PTH1 family peptidyl-tRNA hydrolase